MDWGSEPNIYVVGGAEGIGLALVKEILGRGAFMVGVLDGMGTDTEAVDALDGVWVVQHDLSFSCPDLFAKSTVFHTAYSHLDDPLDRLQSNMRMGLNIIRALTAACKLCRPPRLAVYIPPEQIDLTTRLSVGWLFKCLNRIYGVPVLGVAVKGLTDSAAADVVCDLAGSDCTKYGPHVVIEPGGENVVHHHAGAYSERAAAELAQ